jgi:hypothetical protein
MANNELTSNTLMLYFHSAQHYHLVKYPNHYTSIDPNYDLELSLSIYESKINFDIKKIL